MGGLGSAWSFFVTGFFLFPSTAVVFSILHHAWICSNAALLPLCSSEVSSRFLFWFEPPQGRRGRHAPAGLLLPVPGQSSPVAVEGVGVGRPTRSPSVWLGPSATSPPFPPHSTAQEGPPNGGAPLGHCLGCLCKPHRARRRSFELLSCQRPCQSASFEYERLVVVS